MSRADLLSAGPSLLCFVGSVIPATPTSEVEVVAGPERVRVFPAAARAVLESFDRELLPRPAASALVRELGGVEDDLEGLLSTRLLVEVTPGPATHVLRQLHGLALLPLGEMRIIDGSPVVRSPHGGMLMIRPETAALLDGEAWQQDLPHAVMAGPAAALDDAAALLAVRHVIADLPALIQSGAACLIEQAT